MNPYEFGIKLALCDGGLEDLEKLAIGRSRQYLHEQVFRELAPGAPVPTDMRAYLRSLTPRERAKWNKLLAARRQAMGFVPATPEQTALMRTQQMRTNLQRRLAQQRAIGEVVARGEIGPFAARKQMVAVGKQVARARVPIQRELIRRVPVAPLPLPGGAPAAPAAKGGFLRGLTRFAGKHPLLTAGLAAAGAGGLGLIGGAKAAEPPPPSYWGWGY